MPRRFPARFTTTLADVGGITSTATAFALAANPTGLTLAAGEYVVFTLTNGSTVERIKATTVSGTAVSGLTRSFEGTTASAFPAGTAVSINVTPGAMENVWDELEASYLTAQTTDMIPTAGKLGVQARTKAGWTRLEVMGPSGIDYALQPAFFGNRVIVWKPGSGTTMTQVGLTPTISATASHPAPAVTTLAESLYRTRFACSTTAGNSAGARDAVNTMWGGNAAGRGGFYHVARFCSGSISLTGGQQACVLTSQTGTLAGEPSALPDVLGMIKDSGDTVWQFARRTGSGTVQKVSLGVTVANNQTFDLHLYRRPNTAEVFVRVVQWNYDGTLTVLLDTSYTTDIPAAATLLGFMCHTRNGAVAAANNIELVERFTFSDF